MKWYELNTEKKFLCEQCGFATHLEVNLMRHRITHEPGRFKCPECGRAFRRSKYLKNHMARHADPSTASYQCHICSKLFHSGNKLFVHIGGRCARVTALTSMVQSELISHSHGLWAAPQNHIVNFSILSTESHAQKARKFACNLCPWKFSKRARLQKHLSNVHTTHRGNASECWLFSLPVMIRYLNFWIIFSAPMHVLW